MKKNSWAFKINFVFAAPLLAYSGFGIYWIEFYQYQLNPDGVSYLSIAQKYVHGDFADAINGYWGPLYSWLLTPLLAVGTFPLLAAKIGSLAIGLVTLIGLRFLSYRFEMSEMTRNVLLFAMIPILVAFAFSTITADLLLVGVLVYYLAIIFDPRYKTTGNKGFLCGALGSFAYLAKSYGLPFFLAHFLIFNGLHYFSSAAKPEKKMVLRNLLSGLAIFCFLSGSWIVLISQKYDKFTFSTSGAYNVMLLESGTMLHQLQLIAPPNPTANSYWEDPYWADTKTFEAKRKAQSQAQTGAGATASSASANRDPFRNSKRFENFKSVISSFQSFSKLVLIVPLAGLLFWRPFSKTKLPSNVFYTLLTLMIYSGGYMLIVVEERYLWIACFLAMIVGAYFFDLLYKRKKSWVYQASIALLLIGFLGSFWIGPLDYLRHNQWSGRKLYRSSEYLKDHFNIQGHVASDTNWARTLCFAFLNGYKYYGMTGEKIPAQATQHLLEESKIDYYFAWNSGFEFLSAYKELAGDTMGGLKIYSLQEKIDEETPTNGKPVRH